ncbi:helix-turn-helix domain-containing protein [Marinilabilia rubra]|uniref:Transcriptional regulator n=1 Tax=Marinilabilia rubra TaxID=2162893 RepID=A0A2U2BAH2_9BACT|nr:helix-turn-helix transcriptional regulator [Marinilabilia rubra]PWE00066.1 transcriptional regulator [Marinilabilia rubra]
MKERLQEILKQERLTPARFAELVGVQRSSVSHIISGRNKPSLEFLRKIMTSLEHISPDWLISGVGPYKRADIADFAMKTKQEDSDASVNGTIKFPSLVNSGKKESESTDGSLERNTPGIEKTTKKGDYSSEQPNTFEKGTESQSYLQNNSTYKRKQIVKTILFYDDQTFEVFYQS